MANPTPVAATEVSLTNFQSAFATNYGSIPAWIQAALSALMAALPTILSACGLAATPAGIKSGISAHPLGTNLKLREVCRQAGVPLLERGAAVNAFVTTISSTSDADMTNLITFAQAV